MHDRHDHWEAVYQAKAETEVSWFEETPRLSMALLERAGLAQDMAVIDVGGGASRLVDALHARGQAHISVLDLSAAALARARERLGVTSGVHWINADMLAWEADRRYDIWHDRAAFHFLTTPKDQAAYVKVLQRAVKPGAAIIIGTFALDGPEKCSGLPVARYDRAGLQQVFGDGFVLEHSERYVHTTPWNAVQNFQFALFRLQSMR